MDAVTLAARISQSSGATVKISVCEGVCNKCGERKDLVLFDCVCGSCRDSLDTELADATATDWVLVVTEGPDSFNRQISKALAAKGKAPRPDRLVRYACRNTTYTQMKALWATCNLSDLIAAAATPEDYAEMKLISARFKRPDKAAGDDIAVGTFGGLPRSRLVFIRPAGPIEIAEHDEKQRWYRDVYDAALLKLPPDERQAFAEKLSAGRTLHDQILWDRWDLAVRDAVVATKCPFRIHPTDWWRLPGHRFFSSA